MVSFLQVSFILCFWWYKFQQIIDLTIQYYTDKSHFYLGLSIAKELARRLAEKIGFDNSKEDGTIFFLILLIEYINNSREIFFSKKTELLPLRAKTAPLHIHFQNISFIAPFSSKLLPFGSDWGC